MLRRAVSTATPDDFPIAMFVSPEIDRPMLVGLRRPVILVPAEIARSLDSERLRLIALHEASKLAFFGAQADLADPRRFLRHLAPLRKKR